MQENDKQFFKLRLKLKSGEEFEAEGSLEFVKAQKDEFLRLLNQQKANDNNLVNSYSINLIPEQNNENLPEYYSENQNQSLNNFAEDFNATQNLQGTNPQEKDINTLSPSANINEIQQTAFAPSERTPFKHNNFNNTIQSSATGDISNAQNFKTQAGEFSPRTQPFNRNALSPTENLPPATHLRPIRPIPSPYQPQHRQNPAQEQKSDLHNTIQSETNPYGQPQNTAAAKLYRQNKEFSSAEYNPAYFTRPSATKLPKRTKTQTERPIIQPQQSVWQRIAYADGQHIILRRKDKTLSSAMAALIILGAAQILTNTPKMSALELSRSLKLSGYLKENERLDRILTPEIRLSCLVYDGSKRNREYILTQIGMAKAYTAAERILLNS